MACDHCTDPDGTSCVPYYGVAPHTCFYKIPGAQVGQSQILPRDQWPPNFIEDPDSPGLGVYWCPECGDGKAAAEEVCSPNVRRTITDNTTSVRAHSTNARRDVADTSPFVRDDNAEVEI